MQQSKEIILTYETLYEMLRKEKTREELQTIDNNFLRDALSYLKEKQQSYDDNHNKNDIFSQSERDKLHIQLSNIKKILRDIYDARERKIINMAINKSRTNTQIFETEQMLEEEKKLFENLHSVMASQRQDILNRLLEQKEPDRQPIQQNRQEEPKELAKNTKHVKFVNKTEQFIGRELESYGPYEPNDEANIPVEIAEILITQGKAARL